ncbi:MAG: dTDP-4-dehydrorhamnose 3,5-epimerase [Desulfobacterales bacterium]|nr:dTDP-4-dehydrorhamnose 3,5-epimerase [Desulfobacterales bacterium]
MKVFSTSLKDVLIIEPLVFKDNRGFFMETYQRDRYITKGVVPEFLQDNFSYSVKGTLRGLHFQLPNTQAKLVQVLKGEILDVAVDIRKGSPTFGKWIGVTLNDTNNRQLYIPEGFAHGFAVLSEIVMFTYKCSDLYVPESERGILWNDPDIGIDWPFDDPILSDKDQHYSLLKDMDPEYLPVYKEG